MPVREPVGRAPAGPTAFAELLLSHREAAGLSQRQLARRSGLSERAVRDLERGGTARPRRHSVFALAAALDVRGDDLAVFSATAALGRFPVTPAVLAPGAQPAVAAADRPVGRTDELRALVDLALGRRHRLITVTGPSGVGKSRLLAEFVAVLRRDHPWDVWTLDLSALRDADLVGELISEAVGAGGPSRLSPVERVASRLRGRRALLVLDGVERLVAAAPTVAELVRRCPGLTVVAAGQLALRVAGERLCPLGPLPLGAAVELFARRAGEAAPGFAVTESNRQAVEAVCRQVDGLPLAIELAAARIRMLTPAELLDRLDRPLLLLTGGARDAPARHRSLRAAIESSVEVVGEDSRVLLTWLASFVAGAGLDDLEAVCGRLGAGRGWLLDAVAGLVDSNLVQVRKHGFATRYVLLDAVRDLAAELLRAGPRHAAVERAVATHYLDRLCRTPADGWAALDVDADNLRAALAWARESGPETITVEVVEALYHYYDLRGRFVEGRAELLSLADAGAAGAAWALLRAGRLCQFLDDLDAAERLVLRGRALLADDDHAGGALAELLLGTWAYKRGEPAAALAHTGTALERARAAGDARVIAWALNNLAEVTAQVGDWHGARNVLGQALAATERAGADAVDLGRTLIVCAELALAGGEWQAAARHAARAADISRHGGHRRLESAALSALALARLDGIGDACDLDGAERAIALALRLLDDFGEDRWIRGLVQARRSVVLHACGRLGEVPSALAEAVAATLTPPMRYTLPPLAETHAALLARSGSPGAAALLDLAATLRSAGPLPAEPSASLAALARIVTAALETPATVGRSRP